MGRPLVVVDVQPAYCRGWGWGRLPALVARASDHDRPLLLLVSAEDAGLTSDTVDDCREFWLDGGLDEDAIVAGLRRMIERGVTHSRDLPEGDLEEAAGEGHDPRMEEEAVSLGWIDDRALRLMEGCHICGGGRDECLREVELLLPAHGIAHGVLEEFVRGGAEMAPAPAPARGGRR